ncbi:DUF1289 domain-containing protein [Vibrio sp. 16]|uniref:DUF1289 domain-containing protein n=1 Tax=Vibrio sp. 16 TaxID=391586 RepID=UPI000A038A6B|nr:DUF1289 domain-containing protein [Vibrio sp. 16]
MSLRETKMTNPCVRNCCLDDDDVCLGCFRTLKEILGWNQMTQVQQKHTLSLCRKRRQKSHPFS